MKQSPNAFSRKAYIWRKRLYSCKYARLRKSISLPLTYLGDSSLPTNLTKYGVGMSLIYGRETLIVSGCSDDLYARKVVCWSYSKSPDSELTKKALRMALKCRGQPEELLIDSDQGCHYTSNNYRQQLWRYKIRQSNC